MRLSCCWGRAIMVRMKWPSVPETLSHCLFFALLCSTVKGSCVHPEYNPQKVRFNSTNLWHYVTWEPPRQMASNMTYTVEYLKRQRDGLKQLLHRVVRLCVRDETPYNLPNSVKMLQNYSGDTWRRVSDCTNIVRTRCDLRLTDEDCEYWARVQVVWVGSGCSSEWVDTDCFYPLSDTDLKVLQFNVTYSDGIFVTTIMDSPTPHTKDGVVMTVRYFFPDLEYKVTCQETGTDKMTSLVSKLMDETGMETKRTVTLPVPELGREYCFNATPVLWLNRGKCSHSEQKCLKTHSPYAYLTWKCLLAVVLAGVVFTVCVTGILLYRYIHPNDKTFPKGLLDLDNLPKRNHDLASTQSEDESSISTVTEISSCITSSITTTSELLCSSLGIEEDEEETDTTFVEPYRSRMLISQSGDVVCNWDAPSVNCNYSMACSISKGLVSDSENSDGALHAVSEAQALKMLQSLVISGEHLCNKAKQEKCCENDKDFRKELCNSYATVTVVNEV